MTQAETSESPERFWLAVNDKPILGPFESQDLAIKVRVYVEKVRGREDVWILNDEDLARAKRRRAVA